MNPENVRISINHPHDIDIDVVKVAPNLLNRRYDFSFFKQGPPGTPGDVFAGHATYPPSSVQQALVSLIDRKLETSAMLLLELDWQQINTPNGELDDELTPTQDYVLWLENQLT